MNSNEVISSNIAAALTGAFIFFIWLRNKTATLYKEKKSKEWKLKCLESKKEIKDITWMINGFPIDYRLSTFYIGILELRIDKQITIDRIKKAAHYRLLVLKDEGNEDSRYEELIVAARNYLCERIEYWGAGN